MSEKKRIILTASIVPAVMAVMEMSASAMHIMEGYLPPAHCAIWFALCIPFIAFGIRGIGKLVRDNRKTLIILAMVGAYTFVLSALKIPSVTGSSSHATGTGLGAVLIGPAQTSVLGIIVLLFQALLLAHGGITTLGANTFSMAIAGPFLAYGVYTMCCKLKVKRHVGVFLAACLGDLFTYCVTSIQLGLGHPAEVGGVAASIGKFMGIFAVTQIPLAIIEGLLTVVVVTVLESCAAPELELLGYGRER